MSHLMRRLASSPAAGSLESLLDKMPNSGQSGPSKVPVLLPVALDQTYDYLVPPGLELEPGCFVVVPFGPQSRIGVVWDTPLSEPGRALDHKRLKPVTERLDAPPLPAS